MRSARSPVLVGREDELHLFDVELSRLETGESAAIALVGEPGIGKTRMLCELGQRAERRGYLVLTGSASELEADIPFSVFVDALDEYLRGFDPVAQLALEDDALKELAHVFPAFPADSVGALGLHSERYRTHRAVRSLLEGLAAPKPLVLVLDDFHWADSGSGELLGSLLRRPPAAPVLLALGMRPRLVSGRLSVGFERADRAGTLTRVVLDALTPDETEELVGGLGDGTFAAALFEESGGNPFYVEQLLRALANGGARTETLSQRMSLTQLQVPPAVAAALAQEIGALTQSARLVMQGAAIAGDPFEPELAAAAAGTEESDAVDALDEMLAVELISATDVPRRFRFRHPLVRRAVYESTPAGWRLRAHERTAEALAERGAPIAAQAHHVELSARPGDRSAVATLRKAGEDAAQRAPITAARWFDCALRLVSDTVPAEERVELQLARASLLAATGHLVEGHVALLESLTVVPETAIALRVRLAAACAGVEQLLGLHQQARARLEDLLDEIGASDSPDAGALQIELAVNGMYRTDFEAMTRWAESAVATSGRLQDRAMGVAAHAVLACAAALAGTAAQGLTHCDQAARLVDGLPDAELARRLDALVYLVTAEGYLDRFEPSGRHALRAMNIGRATGQGDVFPLLYAMLAASLWLQGKVVDASHMLDDAVEAARLVDSDHGLAWMLANRSIIAFATGDIELASAMAEESAELSQHLDPGPVSAWGAVARANVLLEVGEPTRAAELLVASAGGEELRMIGGDWRARCLELLTRCRLAAGRRTEADRSAENARACADAVQLPLGAAMANLAEAALERYDGQPARAAALASDAVTKLEEIDDRFDAASAGLLVGRALAEAGDRDGAVAAFQRARAAFASFGASRYLSEAESELRKLGENTYHRSSAGAAGETGIGSLTGRELELSLLVVARKTNSQIAAELFLSHKTVETHLRNIFRKVSVANRVELARLVEQHDRAQGSSSGS